jgi:hypothetical protein
LEKKMKKLKRFLILLGLLPIALMPGCGLKNFYPSIPGSPSVTVTPGATGTAATSTPTSTQTCAASTTPKATATFTPTQACANFTSTSTPKATASITVIPTSTCGSPITLGAAANYVILAGTTITNTGATTFCGNLGLSPGSSVTGAPVLACGGVSDVDDLAAVAARAALISAYTQSAGLASTITLPAGADIGGLTLYPGVYGDSGVLNIGSNVTLDARGNSCAIFIFQVTGGLTVSTAGVQVILTGGAQASNVYWQVAGVSALGVSVSFVGTIMDATAISMGAGAKLTGRALAESEVSLSSDYITQP